MRSAFRPETVAFQADEPVEVALLYSTGKLVNTIWGKRVMFSLTRDRVMFVPLPVADKIYRLGVRPGEPFFIVKNKRRDDGLDRWNVWKPCAPIEIPPARGVMERRAN